MKRIGIYGGSFHPPHVGHVRTAEYARKQLGLDAIVLIPSKLTADKECQDLTVTVQQRQEMLQMAFAHIPGIVISDMELVREGQAYTCDTLDEISRIYPDAQLYLIVGSDVLKTIPFWYGSDRVIAKASVAVVSRGLPGEADAVSAGKQALEAMGAQVHILENPVTAVSSSDIRRMLVFGCADPLLPDGLGAYIRSCGLYGTGKDYRGLSMQALEQVVISLLRPNRVAHVLGCMETSRKLAKHWGVDEVDAARAGLLHDITKAIDGPHQLTLCSQYGIILDKFSQNNPKTLHALTGSLVAERIFGENPAVVSAIRSHTTGKANMNMLEKIIYVADYMEPNRDFPGVEELRRLAYLDMDQALMLGLRMTLDQLKQQGRQVSPESQEALIYLENQ